MPKPSISPGQAILFVLQENQLTGEERVRLESLYLGGCENEDDSNFLMAMISRAAKSSPYLQAVDVLFDVETINNDPSRRYFETHLAYHTLTQEIKTLDPEHIRQHYLNLLTLIKNYEPSLAQSLKDFAEGILHLPWDVVEIKKELGVDASEYVQALSESKEKFSASEHGKIKYVISATFLGLICACIYKKNSENNSELFSDLPLNLYGTGYYEPTYRGRKAREGLHFFSAAGILKGNTPAPYHNNLVRYANTDTRHCFSFKATENSFYVLGKHEKNWSDKAFATLVHPFVNSISGTLLTQLRASRLLVSDRQFKFNEIGLLANYMKCLISSMLYLSGGHSFYEFTYPFKVKEIQQAYSHIACFTEHMTLTNLFYQTNSDAFEAALKSASDYNVQIVNRALVRDELQDTVRTHMNIGRLN